MIWAVGIILAWMQDPIPPVPPPPPVPVEEKATSEATGEKASQGEQQSEKESIGKPDKKSEKRNRESGKGRDGRYGSGTKGDHHSWWDQMNDEQREEARARWKRYREMPEDSKAELDRRLEMLKRETEQMMLELSAEEREALMELEKGPRDRKIRWMLRKRLKEKAAEEGHPVDPPPHGFDGQPLEERLQGSKEQLEERRLRRLQREVDRAVEEGWLGPRAAEFYRTLPPEEVEKELMRFHKWRVLDHFERSQRWKELGIDDAERKRISALPPKEFMDHMRQFRPKRGEGRDGRGHRGRRGEGEGFGRPPRGLGEGVDEKPKDGEEGTSRPKRGDGRRRGQRDGSFPFFRP